MQYRKNLKRWLTPKFINQIQENKISCLNWMCKETISDFEVSRLASLLTASVSTQRLTVMYLGGIEIHSRGIEALSEWIGSESCYLTRLFVRSTSMGDVGAQAIADALESNTSLRELSLTGSKITATGAASLGRALVENDTLVRLSLAHNRIGAVGLTALARGVQNSLTFSSLNVMSNKLEVPKNSDLWDVLVNSSIRELSLGDNAIDDDIVVEFAHSLSQSLPLSQT
jgi:Ran GTPase-activating protein (RanGAP) involved in mRNA processing and transport